MVQNIEHIAAKGKFCSPLFTNRYTTDQQASPECKLYLLSKISEYRHPFLYLKRKVCIFCCFCTNFKLFAIKYAIYLDLPFLQLVLCRNLYSFVVYLYVNGS